MSKLILKIKCPENGVPCEAIYDEEGEVLFFNVETGAELTFGEALIQEANEWCMDNSANCDSIHRANHHLMFLEVKELFDPGEDVLYVTRTINLD